MFRLASTQMSRIGENLCRSSSTIACRRLRGKTAVVTASTDGIGFAIAQRLGEEGANVVVSSRKEKNVSDAISKLQGLGLSVHGVKCHVGDAADRKKLFDEAIKKYGQIDILVSNAGINPTVGPVLDYDESAWDKIFDINVKCSFLLAKEVLPFIRQSGKGGSIVFVSSIAGFQPSSDLLGAYSVSKTALFGLTKAASASLAAENIRVNCIAPGLVNTRFASFLQASEAAREAAAKQIPMKRIAEPDEISGAVAFLVSDDASYVTGETIVISGGTPSRL